MQKVVLYIKNSDKDYQRVDMFDDETISLTSKIQGASFERMQQLVLVDLQLISFMKKQVLHLR